MREGACDYMPKNLVTPDGISQSIRYAIRINEAVKSKSQAEKALRDTETKLNAVIENSPIIIFAIDQHNTFTMFKGKCFEL